MKSRPRRSGCPMRLEIALANVAHLHEPRGARVGDVLAFEEDAAREPAAGQRRACSRRPRARRRPRRAHARESGAGARSPLPVACPASVRSNDRTANAVGVEARVDRTRLVQSSAGTARRRSVRRTTARPARRRARCAPSRAARLAARLTRAVLQLDRRGRAAKTAAPAPARRECRCRAPSPP